MPMKKEKIISLQDFLIAFFLGVIAISLYVRTLVPNLLTADAAEFQTLSYTLGMTHPSGYTTLVFLGKIFTLIPVKNIAYRVNLMSAFFGALAVAQVVLVVRLMGGRKVSAFLGALALSLHPLFWRRNIFAETYAPAASMIMSVWLMMLLWKESKKTRYLFIAGLIGGISVGIHSTVVMTAVAVFFYMLFYARKKKEWFVAGSGALMGLLIFFAAFLYLDYNNPPSSIYNTTYLTNLSLRGLTPEEFDTPGERLLAIFPAQSFWTYYFSADSATILHRLREYLNFYPRWEFLLIFLGAFSPFFLKKDGKRLLPEGIYALTAFLLVWGFAVTVAFGVYKEFYNPVAVIVHVWLGVGSSAFLDGIAALLKRFKNALRVDLSLTPSLLGVAFVAAILFHARADLQLTVQEGYTTFIRDEKIYPYFKPDRYVRLSRQLLNKVEDDAIVFEIWDRLYTHVYTAHILEGRTEIDFHEAFPTLGETAIEYIDDQIDSRPIYFATLHPEIEEYYELEQVGDELYRLRRK